MRYAALRDYVWIVAVVLCGINGAAAAQEFRPLQPLLDEAKPGSTLVLEPGVYSGPAVLDKPLTLDGQGKVTVDGGGRGTVLLVDTDGATVSGLRLIGSGSSHNDLDSGIQVRGKYNVIKDNIIDDTLFGIDLQQSNNNIVRRNRISSKNIELGMRGDAIRLWYSYDNRIVDNVVTNSRDIVVWYSRDNTISRNTASGGRYSLHFMYSQYNLVEDNTFFDNSVGIFVMYSDGVVLRNNHIRNATGTTGVGIGFKETSDLVVENNQILYCANGLYIDVSPYQPDTTNRFTNNLIAYNGIGISFLSDWSGNQFRSNQLKGNLTQVAVGGGGTATRHLWEGNHWDDYEGFDLNGDSIGDTPHEMHSYADRLWMDVPPAQFFKGSPLLEVLDFLERLAPFSPPKLLLRDSVPVMKIGSQS
ncbi:MAG: nitrous oxide reductase family maturation protein NosD [Candidatus Zixiibacteriota bacterium]